MTASLILRGLLVIVAIMSLYLKVANGMVAAPAASGNLRHQLAAFLKREGFRVDENQQGNELHLTVVEAARDECRLLAAIISLRGEHRAFLTQLAAPGDQVRFVFQGKIYKEQPIWGYLMYKHFLKRTQGYAGIGSQSSLVIGVVASPSCGLGDVAWRDFGVDPTD